MFGIDEECTDRNIWSFLGSFSRHMVHTATHVVLLAFVALRSLIVVPGLLLWLLLLVCPLTAVPLILRSLHSMLGTIVGIMSQLTTFETSVGLNCRVVLDWRS